MNSKKFAYDFEQPDIRYHSNSDHYWPNVSEELAKAIKELIYRLREEGPIS